MSNLYIQGNRVNTWVVPYQWQIDFLSESSEDYITIGEKNYIDIKIDNISNYGCKSFEKFIKDIGVYDILNYNNMLPWYKRALGYTTVNKEKYGFLCDLKTGTSRMYIFSDLSIDMMSTKFKHGYLPSICSDCLPKYHIKFISDLETKVSDYVCLLN